MHPVLAYGGGGVLAALSPLGVVVAQPPLCVHASVCLRMSLGVASLEPELQAVVRRLVWVLGPESRSMRQQCALSPPSLFFTVRLSACLL